MTSITFVKDKINIIIVQWNPVNADKPKNLSEFKANQLGVLYTVSMAMKDLNLKLMGKKSSYGQGLDLHSKLSGYNSSTLSSQPLCLSLKADIFFPIFNYHLTRVCFIHAYSNDDILIGRVFASVHLLSQGSPAVHTVS